MTLKYLLKPLLYVYVHVKQEPVDSILMLTTKRARQYNITMCSR